MKQSTYEELIKSVIQDRIMANTILTIAYALVTVISIVVICAEIENNNDIFSTIGLVIIVITIIYLAVFIIFNTGMELTINSINKSYINK